MPMPQNLPHVKLDTALQREPTATLKFNYGYGGESDDKSPEPDYTFMAQSFAQDLNRLKIDVQRRRSERNPVLQVPAHIEYIEIQFHAQFALASYFQQWRNSFGLEAVQLTEFGTKVLFAIVDRTLMRSFLNDIQLFIDTVNGAHVHTSYSNLLIYIKSFKLLTSEDILKLGAPEPLVNLRLTDLPLEIDRRNTILTALTDYLQQNNLPYTLDAANSNLEVEAASQSQLIDIVRNYDVVLQVTSSLATIIRPGRFNQPERSYGFEVANPTEDLPIVAVIDTGISSATPLAPLIIADEDLNLTATPVNQDNTDQNRGHGTAVGALAALGKKPYGQDYQGSIIADARLLPIKIMDSDSAYLSQHAIIEKMVHAKIKYPSLKVFVLTTVYGQHKAYNEHYSTYAYALDKFAYEHDCLVCISTGNNSDAGLDNTIYNLQYFQLERTNLSSPAESMNNLTIGAASHSLRQGHHIGISTGKEYPTLYTRKGHIDFDKLASTAKKNKRLFKPDVIECGGDYAYSDQGTLSDLSDAGMDILSADPTESFYNHIGTSFSTPLVANIAAQIQRQYPSLRSASIKALIVNSASCEPIQINEKKRNNLVGFGMVDEHAAVFSSENSITMVLEETINSHEVKLFPLYFPPYLIQDDLKKANGILYLTATLCFQFMPILQHHQAYCPLHMAFGVFRNHTGEEIQLTEEELMSKLKKSGAIWSQNGRDKTKPIPYTNVQKIRIPINRQELLDESSTFKIAVHCCAHPQLLPGDEGNYLQDNPFSIALTVEENLPDSRLTDQLYSSIVAVNETIAIGTLFAEAEAAEAIAES